MKKIEGLEDGRISVAGLASLLTEIWGNMSIISLNLGEIKIVLHNIDELRKLFLGRRDYNVFNYRPMPIECELEQIDFHYRHRVLDLILLAIKNNTYNRTDFKKFNEVWDDFILVNKYEYGEIPHNWDGGDKAEKTKAALAKIIFEILKSELEKRPGKDKKHRLLIHLSGIKARYNGSDAIHREVTKLMKKYDPKNKYENIWI
jgi:6-pyruvoyl-tetrahydropterin synthase